MPRPKQYDSTKKILDLETEIAKWLKSYTAYMAMSQGYLTSAALLDMKKLTAREREESLHRFKMHLIGHTTKKKRGAVSARKSKKTRK